VFHSVGFDLAAKHFLDVYNSVAFYRFVAITFDTVSDVEILLEIVGTNPYRASVVQQN
jgi:hypothetical protein